MAINKQSDPSNATRKFPPANERDILIRNTMTTVYDALAEKGYDPVGQIVGFILSEDPSYITSHNGARAMISKFDRDELLDALTRFYFSSNKKN